MTNDTGAELTALRETVHAGFARMDRYFELRQAQHLELRGEVQELRGEVQELRGEVQELRGEVQELRGLLVALSERVDRIESRLAGLEETVQRLEADVRALHDWAAREFAGVRLELRKLRRDAAARAAEGDAALRGEIDALAVRVARLERRLEDAGAGRDRP
jgi:chromosome segregation ATPase